MKLTCEIVEDLLPLYLDDSCSADSRSAIEEHLKECSSCREKFQRMQKNDFSWNFNRLNYHHYSNFAFTVFAYNPGYARPNESNSSRY